MDLRGSHVVITGASRGIGAAMAKHFAAEGARLSLVARNLDQLAEVVRSVGGQAFGADLLNQREVKDLIGRVTETHGPVDVLVNNAGVVTTDWLVALSSEEIRDLCRLNLEVPMVLTADVLGGMLERGRGHLVYTSSLAGTGGFPAMATYGATKAGLMNFAASLRLELKGTPIGTTVVAPGPIATDMWDQLDTTPDLEPTITRLRKLQLIPVKNADDLASRTVRAVAKNRRHVRAPRRLSASFWLREVPTRLTEAALLGVQTGPTEKTRSTETTQSTA